VPSDLSPQERVGTDVDGHVPARSADPDRADGPDRGPVRRPEGPEVVPADEGRSGSCHRDGIERVPHPERGTLAERAMRPVPDGVAVFPVPRRVAGVERVGDLAKVADREIPWEDRGQCRLECLGREPTAIGEGDHLPRGVDPGVRASGPVDPPPLPVTEARQRVFQDPLDGALPGVRLEPGELRPVVFDRCAVAHRRHPLGHLL
jgi:hypothetical protein